MSYFTLLLNRILIETEKLSQEGILPTGLYLSDITVEPPRESRHGDISTNAALVLSKPAKMNPIDIANPLSLKLGEYKDIESVEVAGPGFLNLTFSKEFWHQRLVETLHAGENYGKSYLGKDKGSVNIEFVSANPTGPIHVGHARGAVFGDVLASILEFVGYEVFREYYINDSGEQVDILARSAYLRYEECLGKAIDEIPPGYYPGEYLVPIAKMLTQEFGDQYLNLSESEWLTPIKRSVIASMMEQIKSDLDLLGVKHSIFTSEDRLVASGKVNEVYNGLEEKDLIYHGTLDAPKGKEEGWVAREQPLFRSSDFGDDVDRALKKSDGSWTYFATDMAYHADKIRRQYDTLINVWGADHGGYIKRVKAVVDSISDGQVSLDVKLCQMVRLLRDGNPVKMSKRAGDFVTLREVVNEVGRDVLRFIMLTRRNDAPLDFDFSLVTEQSKDNPVFYVQYAHARCCSVLRNVSEVMPNLDLSTEVLGSSNLSPLNHPREIDLIKSISGWPRAVEAAALAHEPHRIAFYLRDLSASFHALWTEGNKNSQLRFILDGDKELTLARMALVSSCAITLSVGLRLIGVTPVEELH